MAVAGFAAKMLDILYNSFDIIEFDLEAVELVVNVIQPFVGTGPEAPAINDSVLSIPHDQLNQAHVTEPHT
jgi:hypothetical protein